MTLTIDDGKLFFQLWFPILDYVNEKCRIIPHLKEITPSKSLNLTELKEVANHLWGNVGLIDEYLALHPELSDAHRELVSSWKRCITGRFIMERYLKKGAIFLSTGSNDVFLVRGISSEWEELFHPSRLPIMMTATLLPFRDGIISDGLFLPANIVFGGGMKKSFKESYMKAKNEGRIIQIL